MKNWFIGMGIAFILLAVGASGILLWARNGVALEDVAVPDAPIEPKEGLTLIKSNASAAERQAEADELQARADIYQSAVLKYQTELTAYNDALNRQSQAQQDYNRQRNSYMLYLIIVVGILGVLALASFLLAFKKQEKMNRPGSTGDSTPSIPAS